MKFKYKTAQLRTKKDFRKAEILVSMGWKVISIGFNSILLEKRKD